MCERGGFTAYAPPHTPTPRGIHSLPYCILDAKKKQKKPTYNIHYMFHVTFSITSATRGSVFREHPWSPTCPRMLLQRRAPTTDINNSDWVNHVERQALKSSVPECVFECIKPHPPTGSGHLPQGEQKSSGSLFFSFSFFFLRGFWVPNVETKAGWGSLISASVGSNNHSLRLFGRPPVRHQKVNHPLRLYEKVAAQEEYAKDHGEGQDAHDGYLDHPHDEEAPLVRSRRHEAVIGHHRGEVAAEELRRLVEQAALRLVQARGVHFPLSPPPNFQPQKQERSVRGAPERRGPGREVEMLGRRGEQVPSDRCWSSTSCFWHRITGAVGCFRCRFQRRMTPPETG